jgi:hypothetical protein
MERLVVLVLVLMLVLIAGGAGVVVVVAAVVVVVDSDDDGRLGGVNELVAWRPSRYEYRICGNLQLPTETASGRACLWY